jgi:hypothetical protein
MHYITNAILLGAVLNKASNTLSTNSNYLKLQNKNNINEVIYYINATGHSVKVTEDRVKR